MKKILILLFLSITVFLSAQVKVNPFTGELDFNGNVDNAYVTAGVAYFVIGSDTVASDTLIGTVAMNSRITDNETDIAAQLDSIAAHWAQIAALKYDSIPALRTAINAVAGTDSSYVTVRFIPTSSIGSPTEGMVYYDSDVDSLYVYDGTGWQALNGGGSGGSMTYPSAGIPLSTGSAWGSSITDNSTNWNTAYGWGDHSVEGYLTTVDIGDINATGTPGGTNYLRGDGTWSTPAGSGDVTKVGTPADDQVAVWTGDGTLEGSTVINRTELEYLNGVTSNIQDQLDAKADAGDTITTVYRNGITATESVTGDSMFVDVDVQTGTLTDDTDSIPNSAVVKAYVDSEIAGVSAGAFDTTYLHFRIDSLATALASAEATIATFSTPSIDSAELGRYNDSILIAFFNKNLYGGSVPANTDFTLTEDGNTHGVNAVSISNDSLILALDSAGAYGSTYLLDYDPGTNILMDSSGNWALAWNDQAVTNNVASPGTYPTALDDGSTQAWYEADASYLTIVNDSVSQWNDRSGNANHLTQSTTAFRPVFAGDSVTFTNDFLNVTATLNDTSTYYVVASLNNWSNGFNMVNSGSSSMIFEFDNASNKIRIIAGGTYIRSDVLTYDSTLYLFTVRFVSEGTSGLLTNGATEITAVAGVLSPSTTLTIGDGTGGGSFSVKEIIIRNKEDDVTDRAAIISYLNTKYTIY